MPYTFFARTFGNDSSQSGVATVPAQPIVTWTDSADGTGGTLHVSGSTPGSVNVPYIAPINQLDTLTFASQAGRTGDGTLSLSLAVGQYVCYVGSTASGATVESVPIELIVTATPIPSVLGGAPMLVKKNAFTPMCWAKTPSGDLIGVNGIDQGVLWDGYFNFPTAPTTYNLGIAAPEVAATIVQQASAGNATAGAYNFYYRYVDFQGRYSVLSPYTVLNAASGDAFAWAFTASPESTRVTQRELWRTISGGANRVYRVAIVNDNTTLTFTDTLSDATLENNAIADPTSTMLLVNGDGTLDALRFNPPPTNKAVVTWYQRRAFYSTDVKYTAGTANVANNTTTVTGLDTNWVPQFIGRYFYGSNAPRGYLIDGIASNGSNISITTPGSPPLSETQTITLPGATCGTWTWTLDGHTTGTLAYNAPATGAGSVQSAIEALSNVGSGNVAVSGSAPNYTLNFQGTLTNTNIDQGTADGTDLCGIPATVTRIVAGSAGSGGGGSTTTINEIQLVGFATVYSSGDLLGQIAGGGLRFDNGAHGEFYLSFNGHNTSPIPLHPDAGFESGASDVQIQSYLESLPSIGPGNVSVFDYGITQDWYGGGQQQWQITFIGHLAGENVPQVTITTSPTAISSGITTADPNRGGLNLEPGNFNLVNIQTTLQDGSGGDGLSGGTSSANEIQTIALPAGTSGGTFTLTTNGHTTAAIAWNATGADVAAALNTATGGSNFAGLGSAGGPFTITFQGAYANSSQSLITVNTTSLTGGTITTGTTADGNPGTDAVETLILGLPTSGYYTLSFGGHTTGHIAYNAPATGTGSIQSALEALASIGTGNVAVAETSPGVFTVTFQGTLKNTAQALITYDFSNLAGYPSVDVLTLHTPYGGPTATGISYVVRPAPEDRNQIYYSENDEAESVPVTNTIRCQQSTERDDEIVGSFNHGPYLYFLQQNHLIVFDYQDNPQLDGNFALVATRGAFNNRCWATIGDIAFIMDREGAYVLQAGTVEPISDRVQNYWRESVMDFSKTDRFFVSADPTLKLVRFHYCAPGDQYPRQALVFNPVTTSWNNEYHHEEMGAMAVYPVGGKWRTLLGGKSGLVHLTNQGTADGIDSATETGTVYGTATGSTANTLTDSTATFTATMIGAPVAIIAGTAKGQVNYILSQTSTALTFQQNWGVAPAAGDTYLIGAIPWTYKTGDLRFIAAPTSGDVELPREMARAIRAIWQPTDNKAFFDMRRFFDNNPNPVKHYSSYTQGDGLTIAMGDVSAVQEMTLNRSQVDGVNQPSIGYTRYELASGGEDFSIMYRFLTVYLLGYQSQDPIKFYTLTVEGVEQGG